MVTRTTSLAATSSTATPRPAWIWAPRSTTSRAVIAWAERVPCWWAVLSRVAGSGFLPLSWLMDILLRKDGSAQAGPGGDRIGRADQVHAGVGEALERGLGLGGEVDGETAAPVGHGDRRHAVGDDVDLAGERGVGGDDLGEEVVDRALHAVAGGLAGDDDGVGGEQGLDELGVALGERRAVEARQHLGAQHRVVLGQRVAALDLAPRLRAAGEGVEQAGLVDDAGEGVAVGAEQAVRRPQVELVLAGLLELAA